MSLNKLHIIWALCLLCVSCVEPYEPVLEESQEVLVISGMISDSPGRHEVRVSLSSPYSFPEFQGVEQCLVNVTDQDGNTIHYTDEGNGTYVVDLTDPFLEVGDAASLYVFTPDGREYRSTFDTLLSCPELDSVYWELETQGTADPEKSLPGIQFYLDMTGSPDDSRNIIWRLNETWEFWASLFGNMIMRERYYMERFLSRDIFKCWDSQALDQIYTASTRNLSSNSLRRVPLHFVSNQTERLQITYSLYVRQQSLSLEAYDYWQRMNKQAAESGGLYEEQPASVPGNIYAVDQSDGEVLGFFYASQVKETRIYVHNNNLFDFWIPKVDCEYQPLSSLWQQPFIKYPVYIYVPGPFQPSFWGPAECFDCRLQGGDTIRPIPWETWP
jgi:hypothetical protein